MRLELGLKGVADVLTTAVGRLQFNLFARKHFANLGLRQIDAAKTEFAPIVVNGSGISFPFMNRQLGAIVT